MVDLRLLKADLSGASTVANRLIPTLPTEANQFFLQRRYRMNSAERIRRLVLGVLAVSSLFAGGSAASAQQQTTGTPGSPDATITVDSRYLPPPPQRFQGEIGLNADQS